MENKTIKMVGENLYLNLDWRRAVKHRLKTKATENCEDLEAWT